MHKHAGKHASGARAKQGSTLRRGGNIALRTAHIGVTGVLLGGHVFGAVESQLIVWLYLTIGTGALLVLIEAYPHWHWCCQLRGLLVIAKVLLLCLIPWLWSYRIALLAVVVVIACAGSHMPGKYRYYSVLHRRVLEDVKRN